MGVMLSLLLHRIPYLQIRNSFQKKVQEGAIWVGLVETYPPVAFGVLRDPLQMERGVIPCQILIRLCAETVLH